jgi:hypothetical protein
VSWFAAVIFYNITSIGEVKSSSDGAKGLHLHDLRRAKICSSGALIFAKKKKRRKIEAIHRKFKRNFKPNIRKISVGMSLFEQTPYFTADKYLSTMNS